MNSQANKATGYALRQLRKSAGLTQIELAGKLGKPQSHVSKLESGERSLRVHELVAIARALGVPASRALDAIERAL